MLNFELIIEMKNLLKHSNSIVIRGDVFQMNETETGFTADIGKLKNPGEPYKYFAGDEIPIDFEKNEENNNEFLGKVSDSKLGDEQVIRIRSKKQFTLDKYDPDEGSVTFRDETYPTEELLVKLYIFKGDVCLTGTESETEARENSKKIIPGLNKIFIKLNDGGNAISDCIIDGVVLIENEKRMV